MQSIVSTPPAPTPPVYDRSSPQAAQFRKDVPYRSAKYDLSNRSENGHHFTTAGRQIWCRHLSLQFIIDTLLGPGGKWDRNNYQGTEITRHVHPDSEKIFSHLAQMADNPKLIDNTRLGENLCAQFEKMELSGKSVGAALLLSGRHAMAVRLRIKLDSETGLKKYVMAFYDPNNTASQVRMAECVCTGLPNLRSLTTTDLLGEDADAFHFQDSNTAMLVPISQEKLATVMDCVSKNSPVNLPSPDQIDHDYTLETINPEHISHLVYEKFHQNVREIAAGIAARGVDRSDPGKLLALIEGKGSKPDSALKNALLAKGSQQIIEAYADLFRLVPADRRADFLIAISNDAVMACLASGHVDNIRGYRTLLELVPPQDRERVLVAVRSRPLPEKINPDGSKTASERDGLSIAMEYGHADAILEYTDLYSTLPEPLSQYSHLPPPDFPVAIRKAFRIGDAGNIRACLALLKLTPEAYRAELIADIDTRDITASFERSGNHSTPLKRSDQDKLQLIELYAEVIAQLPAEDRQRYTAPVLAPLKKISPSSVIHGGVHGFKLLNNMLPLEQRNAILAEVVNGKPDRALLFGHDGEIANFQRRLDRTPPEERARFLEHELGDSIGTALQRGHLDVIQSCRVLLMAVPGHQVANVLQRLTGSAIEIALESGNAKVISAYRELLLLAPANQRTELVRRITGFGLHEALSNNRADAIKAYRELLDLLPENERAGLLSEVINGGLANALSDRQLGAIAAFGNVLKSIPEHHRAIAYLPKEAFRKNELFLTFHSSGPPSKSTFVHMLRDVDEVLVEHFKQSKQQCEALQGLPESRNTGSIYRPDS